MEADEGDSPSWPTSGCFTEKYTGVTATTLGRGKTIFKALEATELKKDDSEWVPFRDEDEWHLAQFLMKNLGQTKINEFLKLSHVSK